MKNDKLFLKPEWASESVFVKNTSSQAGKKFTKSSTSRNTRRRRKQTIKELLKKEL